MLSFDGLLKRIFITYMLLFCMATLVFAGPSDIKPTPILNLQAGISDELIVSIRRGDTKIDELIIVFSEEEQKNLPLRIDQKFTPLCAAASGRNVKAIKQLIELGANVNSMCINMGMVNNPLELAFRVPGQQDTENEASKLLKSNGAEISDGWVEAYKLQKYATQLVDEEIKKNVAENGKMLAGIFLKIAQSAISQKILFNGNLDANKLSGELISTTTKVSKERKQQEIEVVSLSGITNSFVHETPFTHSTRSFFADLKSGESWCSSFQPTEQLIYILTSMNATLVKMNGCSCVKAGVGVSTLPYVCGIPYAYKTKKHI